jgi:hypothetical protein
MCSGLQASGAKAVEWEVVDVSDATAMFAAAEQLGRRLGSIDNRSMDQ